MLYPKTLRFRKATPVNLLGVDAGSDSYRLMKALVQAAESKLGDDGSRWLFFGGLRTSSWAWRLCGLEVAVTWRARFSIWLCMSSVIVVSEKSDALAFAA